MNEAATPSPMRTRHVGDQQLFQVRRHGGEDQPRTSPGISCLRRSYVAKPEILHHHHRHRDHDRDRERETDPGRHSEGDDGETAEGGTEDARHPDQCGLHRERHRAAIARQRITDHREGRRERTRLPRHHSGEPKKDIRPAGGDGVDRVSCRRATGEHQQGPPASDSIGEPPSGVLIEAVQQ